MRKTASQRLIFKAVGLACLLAFGPAAHAQESTLEKIRTEGVIRVGVANQPPYSGMDPSGAVTGYVPTLVQEIMAKLGVPKVEGIVATYGELVPGLQAGRWDMIASSFRLNADRCQQVLFADPITFDGGAFAYLPGEVSDPPQSLQALGEMDVPIGVVQGSYLIQLAEDRGLDRDNISQFPNGPALIDGLVAKRMQFAVSTNASLKDLQRARSGVFEIVYPVSDDPPVGSAPAFRRDDTELHAAFQQELRAMRQAGALLEMSARFGFDPPPADLMEISSEEACARLQ